MNPQETLPSRTGMALSLRNASALPAQGQSLYIIYTYIYIYIQCPQGSKSMFPDPLEPGSRRQPRTYKECMLGLALGCAGVGCDLLHYHGRQSEDGNHPVTQVGEFSRPADSQSPRSSRLPGPNSASILRLAVAVDSQARCRRLSCGPPSIFCTLLDWK